MSYDDEDSGDRDERRKPRKRDDENPFENLLKNLFRNSGISGDDFKDLFDQLDTMVEDISKSTGLDQFFNNNSLGGDGNFTNFIKGYKMTRGTDGRPRFEKFGHSPRKNEHQQENIYEREPLVDVIENDDKLMIIAEVPGVSKQDIDLSTTENSLLIKAKDPNGTRTYYKELNLPHPIDPTSAKAKFKNGVLEVELTKLVFSKEKKSNVKIQ